MKIKFSGKAFRVVLLPASLTLAVWVVTGYFSIQTRTDTVSFNNLPASVISDYRKYQNTIEGDYAFNSRHSINLGYH